MATVLLDTFIDLPHSKTLAFVDFFWGAFQEFVYLYQENIEVNSHRLPISEILDFCGGKCYYDGYHGHRQGDLLRERGSAVSCHGKNAGAQRAACGRFLEKGD